MKEGEETRRVLLLTWQVPLKFWEYCCIQLLLVARGFVAMATQPCAPAQGRSSSSEPSGAAHRMHTGGRGLFKVTNKKACGQLANSAPPAPAPWLTFSNKETNRRELWPRGSQVHLPADKIFSWSVGDAAIQWLREASSRARLCLSLYVLQRGYLRLPPLVSSQKEVCKFYFPW